MNTGGHFTSLDILVLVLYFAVMMAVGVACWRKSRSVDGFTAAERSMPGWITVSVGVLLSLWLRIFPKIGWLRDAACSPFHSFFNRSVRHRGAAALGNTCAHAWQGQTPHGREYQ